MNKNSFMSQKPNILKTFSRLIRYILQHHAPSVLLMLVFIFAGALVEIQIARFMGELIDKYIIPMMQSSGNPDFGPLVSYIVRMAFVFGTGVLAAFCITRLGATISQKVLTRLRHDMFSHMQDLSIPYFDTHSHGEIMGLYTNDLDTLVDVVSQSIPQSFAMFVNVTFLFIMMWITNAFLTLYVVGYIAVVVLITYIVTKKSNAQFRQVQQRFGIFNGFVEESIYSQKVIKVFSHEEYSKADFNRFSEDLRKSADIANKLANTFMPLLANVGNILYVILVGVGVGLMTSGNHGVTVGILVTFLQLTRAFVGPFAQISQHLNSIVRGSSGADRIFRFLDEKPESDSGNTTLVYALENADGTFTEVKRSDAGAEAYWKREYENADPEYVKLKGDVRFFNVCFSYDGEKEVLHDINIYAKPGQKIALVGSTGAGKTTVTNLINRFYDINQGKITIDGIDISQIRKADLRRSMAVVLQETHLFSGTIRDNIRYGRLDASDEDVERAAKIAHADDFIRHFKDGYDTVISGTDCQLSEGQKQLVTIARVAVADPPILVLDEATSSVDSVSEQYVEKAMDEIMKGRTTFVIAHRLSTIRNASAIMVLEHGNIIERGDHDDLLKTKGRYYELYTGKVELS